MTLKSAKEYLASGDPLPDGVSPEDLPATMSGVSQENDRGHGDHIPRSFVRMTPLDRTLRRALWARYLGSDDEGEVFCLPTSGARFLELRAGREGDDAHVLLQEGETLTAEKLDALLDLLWTMKDGLEQ